MASIRVSRGRLFLDYRLGGMRKRVYCKLPDTPECRAYLRQVAAQLDAAAARGEDVDGLLEAYGLTAKLSADLPSTPATRIEPAVPSAVTPLLSPTPLMSSFAERWFNEFKVGWRRTYVVTVRGILDKHLIPQFGSTPIGAIGRAQILDFRSRLAEVAGRRPGSKLSPARINTVMLILRQILQEGADRYDFTVPMARIRPLKIPKKDIQPFTLDEVQLLVRTVRADYQNYMVVRFLTGMRSGELHGLKWKYVDFERRLILVREAIVAGEEDYTKTDSSQRDIQMSQPVYEALRRQHQATGRMTYVFCNQLGQAIDTTNFTKRIWYPLLRHLRLELRRPYQTRHTAATLWLAAGESPEWIARTLGHSSTELLFSTYSRFVPNLTKRDGAQFDRLLAEKFSGRPESSRNTGEPDASSG